MTGDAALALAAISWAVLAAVIRMLWKLSERMARLEGRLRERDRG